MKVLAKGFLRASGLASLGPVVPLPATWRGTYDAAADALLERGERPAEIPVLSVLRWLAQQRARRLGLDFAHLASPDAVTPRRQDPGRGDGLPLRRSRVPAPHR